MFHLTVFDHIFEIHEVIAVYLRRLGGGGIFGYFNEKNHQKRIMSCMSCLHNGGFRTKNIEYQVNIRIHGIEGV